MIKVIQCQCSAKVKFDLDKVMIFEYKDDVITGLIICPVCKQLIEVTKKHQPWDGGIDNVKPNNFDEAE